VVVVAPDLGGAIEFAAADHAGVLEHAPALEALVVVEQACGREPVHARAGLGEKVPAGEKGWRRGQGVHGETGGGVRSR
jgi:hypothetical protein